MNDYSGVFAGLSVSPAVAALVAAGTIIAAVYFARWLTDTVANFFADEYEGESQEAQDYWRYACSWCGEPKEHEESSRCDACNESRNAYFSSDDGDESEDRY